MNLRPNDFNALIICAFRYALGRSSYVTAEIANIVRQSLSCISPNVLRTMCKEIEFADERNDIGMACDREIWFEPKRDINKHLKEVLKNEN